MIQKTKLFVTGLIVLSAFLFAFNIKADSDTIGKAFYISEGKMGMMDTEYPYQGEVASINTVFWGFILIVMIGYIIMIHILEHKDKQKK